MNVIFIVSDTFRRDNLSCYGPTTVKTPSLDRLAGQSIVFDNYYLGSFPTVPNRLETMTGQFSCIRYAWQALPAEAVTLPMVLSASGITTQFILDTPHLIGEGFNYCRDFDGWEWIRGQETDRWKTSPRDITLPAAAGKLRMPEIIKRHYRNAASWKGEEDHFVARTMRQACQWLEDNQGLDKFFLWVDTFDPHEPWDPPQKYIDLYEKDYHGESPNYPRYTFWRDFYSQAELDHMRACYRAEASLVDHWIGVLLDKIDELGMGEDTAVIFASDHGFLIGEHDFVGKEYLDESDGQMTYEAIRMYSDVRRIPLMLRLPGERGGRHIGALVQPVDLAPTILELEGLVSSETVGGVSKIQELMCGVFRTSNWSFRPDALHGTSLLPLVRGETDKIRDVVACSHTLIHHTPVLAKSVVVTEDGWCLYYSGVYDDAYAGGELDGMGLIDPGRVRNDPRPGLFHLPSDPGEEHDCIASNEPLARDIHARYVAFLEQIGTPPQHLAGRRRLR